MIIEKIMEADGIIFASPVYSLMVSALMKNFLTASAIWHTAKIPSYKKFIAKKISDKIISQFD